MDQFKRCEPSELFPLVRSLLVAQLTQRREPWSVKQQARTWTPSDALDESGIGLDSFDLLTVAGQVSTMFHLHELGIEECLLARRTPHEWAELILYAWNNLETPRLTFLTSGTTSAAKAVTHELARLDEEVSAFLELLPAAKRTLAYVASHHIYGFLFAVLVPIRDGCEVIPAYLNPLGEQMREGDRVVAIPEIWRLLIGRLCAHGVHGISSTAPLPADVACDARRRGVHLFEVYGSTESAGVGYRSETAAPYALLPYWKRIAIAGEQRGETALERPAVADPILPPDHLRWVDERHFVPVGRRDEMVQVGGYNVSPKAIARRIEALESVEECAVRLMQEHEGERLKAVVVPANREHDPAKLQREVDTWAVSHLAGHERPGHILVADRLPTNEMGKLADWPLPTPTTLR